MYSEYKLPEWAQSFYDTLVSFLKENGYTESMNDFGKVLKKGFAFFPLTITNSMGIRNIASANYGLLYTHKECPIKIDGHPVLYFDEIDGTPTVFFQYFGENELLKGTVWSAVYDEVESRWKHHGVVVNKMIEYFLTRIGFPPIQNELKNV